MFCSASRNSAGDVGERAIDEGEKLRRASSTRRPARGRGVLGAKRAKVVGTAAGPGSDRRAASDGRCAGRAGSGRLTRASSASGGKSDDSRSSTATASSECDEADAIGDPEHVPIDRQAGHAERVAEDDVRRFSADAWQRDERVHRRGDFAAVRRRRALAPCRRARGTSSGRNRSA